jgi:hypothetical protein
MAFQNSTVRKKKRKEKNPITYWAKNKKYFTKGDI